MGGLRLSTVGLYCLAIGFGIIIMAPPFTAHGVVIGVVGGAMLVVGKLKESGENP